MKENRSYRKQLIMHSIQRILDDSLSDKSQRTND